ncbi:uncharacterized protein LOC133977078 [Scomber scombrus]|uniref:uncharacterized protein LOC133977078 n=1 Tax=Scomber scombrus TaxID=13677 RepID=UPI002DD7B9D1|nr:uncharacterized protein LOC133977078 [Scomber scombrus]
MATSDLSAKQLSAGCNCPLGYFVKQCGSRKGIIMFTGTECKLCSECSDDQVILEPCSMFADSRCGNKSSPDFMTAPTPTGTPVSTPGNWIILAVIFVAVSMILLLGMLVLLKLCCRNHQRERTLTLPTHNKPLLLDNKTLPTHNKPLLLDNKTLPTHNKPLLLDNKTLPTHNKPLLLDNKTLPTHNNTFLLESKPVPSHEKLLLPIAQEVPPNQQRAPPSS